MQACDDFYTANDAKTLFHEPHEVKTAVKRYPNTTAARQVGGRPAFRTFYLQLVQT